MNITIVLIITFIVIILCFAGLGIKMLVRHDGAFKRHCSSMDPYTGEKSGCTCSQHLDCTNRQKHPFQPLEVNEELMKEVGTQHTDKKNISSALFLVMVFAASFAIAQNGCDTVTAFPWTEGFESGNETCWHFIDNDGNGRNWTIGDLYPNDGSYSLIGTFSPTLEDNWAISPAIAIPSDATDATLTWQVYAHPSYSETYEVLITSGHGDTLANYELLFGETVVGGYFERQATLDNYIGQTVHIAFRHRSENQNFICIDDIRIGISERPTANIIAPETAIVNQTVNLVSECTNTTSLLWTIEGGTPESSTEQTVNVVWSLPGTYTIILTATNSHGSTEATKEITINSPNGINTESNTEIVKIYPNPTNSTATIKGFENANVEVISMNGRRILQKQNDGKLDLSQLEPGIYIVRMVSNRRTVIQRIAKQ